ncbi:MAG: YkuS family protein [Caulobacteraceae bacterium]
MNIAIQRGLDSLKNELESRGYSVFYIGDNKMADAVLYKDIDTHPYYDVNNIPSAAASSIDGHASYGALLLNVTNKTLDEILLILERRVYSPLL